MVFVLKLIKYLFYFSVVFVSKKTWKVIFSFKCYYILLKKYEDEIKINNKILFTMKQLIIQNITISNTFIYLVKLFQKRK